LKRLQAAQKDLQQWRHKASALELLNYFKQSGSAAGLAELIKLKD